MSVSVSQSLCQSLPPLFPLFFDVFSELQWMFFFVQVVKLDRAVACLWEVDLAAEDLRREEVGGSGRLPLMTRPIKENKQF